MVPKSSFNENRIMKKKKKLCSENSLQGLLKNRISRSRGEKLVYHIFEFKFPHELGTSAYIWRVISQFHYGVFVTALHCTDTTNNTAVKFAPPSAGFILQVAFYTSLQLLYCYLLVIVMLANIYTGVK